MLMPSIFRESLFDDFFGSSFPHFGVEPGRHEMMKTDIKETAQSYEMTMKLPGVKKEDVKAELKDGYLTIQASSNTENNTQDDDGRYIRRERYMGSCSRSFYVGTQVSQEEIKARFEDGILKLLIPKKEAKPMVEDKKYIAIEG